MSTRCSCDPVASQELVDRIGLESDTNLSHSRRVLVLEESRSLLHPALHDRLVKRILERYLFDYSVQESRVPRFLMNDILRYWRTVAVDYQAKRWEELRAKKWGLRYLKLRSTRKLTFAGSLAGTLMPAILGDITTADSLKAQFDKPALARIASLAPVAVGTSAEQPLRRVLRIADRFVGWLAAEDWRNEMAAVVDPKDAKEGSRFELARDETVSLQSALDGLFHSDIPVEGSTSEITTLRDLTRHYLMF